MIDIIITTKNEQKNIYRCLKSCEKQKFVSQIFVIDNFSTDNTKLISNSFNVKFYYKGNERSKQRNFGILKCKSEYILILDADMTLPKNFCSKLFKHTKYNKSVDAFYLREKIISKNNLLSKIRNYERSMYDKSTNNCPRFFKRNLFKKIGMFDEKITGFEDWDLNNRITINKIKTRLLNLHFNHHEKDIYFMKMINKKSYYYFNSKLFKTKWRKYKNLTNDQLNLSTRLVGIYFKYENYKKILKSPIIFTFCFCHNFIKITLISLSIIFRIKNFIH